MSAIPDIEADAEDVGSGWLDLLLPLLQHWAWLLLLPPLAAAVAFGASYLVAPTYTAQTRFFVPQPTATATSAAAATLSALSGAAAGSQRNPTEQYVSLLQSHWVTDRLIDRFKLMQVYEVRFRFEARAGLAERTRILPGRRDGLITIEFDDTSPQRAAEIANRYVEELRLLSGELALTEAQQRREFFKREFDRTRKQLASAQEALQSSGFDERTLRAEPRAAAETYARARAETTAAEIRLAALRRSLTDTAPEIQQQIATVEALRQQLARAEQALGSGGNVAYMDRYREFKYQEGLYEFIARQLESARLDESRDGALLQVVDPATVPEWKTKPRRLVIALIAYGAALLVVALYLVGRARWRASRDDPEGTVSRLRQALKH